jgi:ribosomal protein S18 acetylase RimI-like enzyme
MLAPALFLRKIGFLTLCLGSLVEPYLPIPHPVILKKGMVVTIKDRWNLQEDDPEIGLLKECFPQNTYEGFIFYDQDFRNQFASAYLLVNRKSTFIGTIAHFHIPELSIGYVTFLAVDPMFRRSGVGKALMEHVEKKYAALGCASLHLESTYWAEAFYLALGYTRAKKTNLLILHKNLTVEKS